MGSRTLPLLQLHSHHLLCVFLLPVCCVLKFCVFRKEMLLKTVAETKPWHNQQVLGVSLPAAKEFFPAWFCDPMFVQPAQEPLPSLSIPALQLPPHAEVRFLLSGGPKSLEFV